MDLYGFLEEVSAIARIGLLHTDNTWDRDRYERLLSLTLEVQAEALDLAPAELRGALAADIGYVTPKVGAEVAVFDEEGRALLVQLPDGAWAMPGGFVDPGESPAEAAVREGFEETGIELEIVELVDAFFRPASARTSGFSLVAIVYLCRAIGGGLQVSHEHNDLGYRAIDDVELWRGAHKERLAVAHRRWVEMAR